MRAEQIANELGGARRNGNGWWSTRCCCREDKNPSLSLRDGDNGTLIVKCHKGCDPRDIKAELRRRGLLDDRQRDFRPTRKALLPPKRAERGRSTDNPPNNRATVQLGLTLEQYAAAKALPIEFLKGCGLSDVVRDGKPAVRIPYFGVGGEELAVRFRIALDGDRFRWKSGSKTSLYGLNRLSDARAAGQVVLVEGESDAHTL